MIKKLLLIGILLTGIVYGLGVIYSDHRFLPNTYVDGVRLDGQGLEKETTVTGKAPVLTIAQTGLNGETVKQTLDLADAGYTAVYKVKDLLAGQDHLMWFKSLFSKTELTGIEKDASYNTSRLLDKIGELYCFKAENSVEPVDAHIEIQDGVLTLVPEENNHAVDKDSAQNEIIDAIKAIIAGETAGEINLTDNYAEAKVKSADIEGIFAQMVQDLSRKITIKISNGNSVELEGKELKNLFTVENNELSVDPEKVDALVDKICDDNGVSNRDFILTSKLIRDLNDALAGKEDATISADWIETDTPSGITNRVEVSLLGQTLYYYENNKLVFTSPIVSAAPGVTPTGTFEVTKIDGESILSGPTWEERVEYWIGFDPTGVHKGFHDASWRDEFGGEIYKTDPSHGCVNMPTDMVARLWDLVKLGTPVIIYE